MSMVYHFPQAADTTVCKTYDCSGQDRQQKYEQFFSYPHLTFHLIFLIPHDIPGSPADHRNNFSKRLPACFAVEWISEYEILSMFPDRSISPFSRFTRFTCRSVPLTISIPCSVSSNISFRLKDSTSRTPVTSPAFRLFNISLWFFCAATVSKTITTFLTNHMKRKSKL